MGLRVAHAPVIKSVITERLSEAASDPVIASIPTVIAILLPNLRGGGAERVAVNLANGFAQRGYAVDMLLLSATGVFLADLLPVIRVVDLRADRMRGALLPLVRYLRKSRPDVMLACLWPLTLTALWTLILRHLT